MRIKTNAAIESCRNEDIIIPANSKQVLATNNGFLDIIYSDQLNDYSIDSLLTMPLCMDTIVSFIDYSIILFRSNHIGW